MLEMNPEIRKQWCAALRSGDYTQAQKQLRVRNEDGTYGYCCLGVLTDLYVKAGNPEQYELDDVVAKVWEDGTLPNPVSKWAGLSVSNPTLQDRDKDGHLIGSLPASEWNDDHDANFAKIADMIDGGDLAAKLKASLVIREPKG